MLKNFKICLRILKKKSIIFFEFIFPKIISKTSCCILDEKNHFYTIIMPLLCPRACHLCPGPIICYNRHATYAQDRLFAIMGMPLMPRTDNCARLPSLDGQVKNFLLFPIQNRVRGSLLIFSSENHFVGHTYALIAAAY